MPKGRLVSGVRHDALDERLEKDIERRAMLLCSFEASVHILAGTTSVPVSSAA